MPWDEAVEAIPMGGAGELGPRDRLSLVAQFSAHQALLRFAGFSDAAFDSSEWAIVRRRGSDPRLVRTGARACDEPPPALTTIGEFAAVIAAPPLDALRQPWGRAESVYIEIDARLRGDAAADLRWMRAAAWGEIAAPGDEGIREVFRARGRTWRGTNALEAIRAAAALGNEQVIELGDSASPLQRYSAILPLSAICGALEKRSESDIVERIVDAASRAPLILGIRHRERFDAASARVVEMIEATRAAVIISDRGELDLAPARLFVVAPSLAAQRALEPLGRAVAEALVASDAFGRFLETGEIAVHSAAELPPAVTEPARSYVAAVALLGRRVPLDVANAFLAALAPDVTAAELAFDGVTLVENGALVFTSDEIRDAARRSIPLAAQSPLGVVAAKVLIDANGDAGAAATLLIEAGDARAAAVLLERATFASPAEAVATIRSLPRTALTPPLAETFASALIDCGRYRDARDVAAILSGDTRELLLARIERRTGDYASALRRLEAIGSRSALRAELLYLESRFDDMREALDACGETSPRVTYLRALLADETGAACEETLPQGDYLAARLATYRAIAACDLEAAARHAAESLDRAATIGERIDAALDRVYVLFTAGAWEAARNEALQMLSLVEETQGDRAAGGVLFLLAYLAADDGQWAHAAQLVERLRQFYRGTRDERRLRELDLLAAHLHFAQARFGEAMRLAQPLDAASMSPQIREAAALILDESDWIEGRITPLRSTGASGNIELTRRHAAMRARRDGRAAELPEPRTRSDRLRHLRDALGRGDDERARQLARELDVALPRPQNAAAAAELRAISAAATREFPFAAHDFAPHAWRFATRNRLGQWHEIGSLAAMPTADLDAVNAAGARDWIACSEREMLFFEGISAWPADSRDALAATFRARAENHRMRRVIEQDESARANASEAIDGIIGESPAMRELFAVIPRLARRDVPVCVLGESGTGKELVARAIHRHSPRRGRVFTAVNCAALPENLIESELFGAVRGAFTGADRDRAGLIETSDGGTLFLDEIGEMPPAAQAKLLRFLQEGEFRRVGDTQNRTADVRIVSATNRQLEAAVEEGRFREDLYYRIGGVEVRLPALRDRGADVALLAHHFVAKERERSRGGPVRLSPDAEAAVLAYRWPGNVRELQNTIRAAHALAGDAASIEMEHLPERMRNAVVRGNAAAGSYQDALTRFRRELIEKSLLEANGNQNRAATMLDMSRQALAYQIRELGILVRPRK